MVVAFDGDERLFLHVVWDAVLRVVLVLFMRSWGVVREPYLSSDPHRNSS